MAEVSPAQVYDQSSTSEESSKVPSNTSNAGDQNHDGEDNNTAITDRIYATNGYIRNQQNNAENLDVQQAYTLEQTEIKQRAPNYQQELNPEDFLPNPMLQDKSDILLKLKCSFVSLLAARIFSLHYDYL